MQGCEFSIRSFLEMLQISKKREREREREEINCVQLYSICHETIINSCQIIEAYAQLVLLFLFFRASYCHIVTQ